MTTSITEIIEKANAGDVAAQHEIDHLTGAPKGTYAQLVEGFAATKAAAEMGSVECMEILGQSYYTGMGGAGRDIALAEYWLEKASIYSASATWYLGQIHASQHEDYDTAKQLLQKAVDMGLDCIPKEEIEFSFKTIEMLKQINKML